MFLPLHAAVSFTSGPSLSTQSGKFNVSFTVSEATDVEVAIVDHGGKIVRHLAAGVLGGQYPPPAPLVQGLSQNVEWDGRDDNGSTPSSGPLRARVRLGLTPAFERSLTTRVAGTDGNYNQLGMYWPNPAWQRDFLEPEHYVLRRIYGCFPLVLDGQCNHRAGALDIAVSDATETVYIKPNTNNNALARVNGATGEFLGMLYPVFPASSRSSWGEPVISWDGQYIYHTTGLDVVHRYNLNGTTSSWPGTGQSSVTGLQQGYTHSRGLAAGPDGSVYVLHYHNHCGGVYQGDSTYQGYVVSRISPQGSVAQREFIKIETSGSGGVKVDPKGNVFVSARVKPSGRPWPSALDGQLSKPLGKALKTESSQPWQVFPEKWWAAHVYGSILKFGPSGGSITRGSGNYWVYGSIYTDSRSPVFLTAGAQGLLGMYYGMSHTQAKGAKPMGGYSISCVCNVSRFDVDRFGRVFVPDGFRLSLVVLDNNLNEIIRFRNHDVTQRIGYMHQFEVTDRAVYGADW
jgi:hypothetical protein